MQQCLYQVGDNVRHVKRPEWGIGSVTRVERTTVRGQEAQRLVIRFPNGGMKTLSTIGAELVLVETESARPAADVADTMSDREEEHEPGWLGKIAKTNPQDALLELPPEATDPFRTVRERLGISLGLYRFSPEGGSLIDWAVARTGLDDPLSRFTRSELEQYFERWSRERQAHLARILQTARNESLPIDDLIAAAPPQARQAIGRSNGQR